MSENFVFQLFDTCDVVYIWSISLFPPLALVNLFGKATSVIDVGHFHVNVKMNNFDLTNFISEI